MKAFGLCVLVVFGAACGSCRLVSSRLDRPVCGEGESGVGARVVLVSHGWHTGVVIPAKDLNRVERDLAARFQGAKYYELGWGDERFYRAGSPGVGDGVCAMFASKGSVMHVVGLKGRAEVEYPRSQCVGLRLNRDGYQRFLAEVQGSFERSKRGGLVDLGTGLYGDSEFYLGRGKYGLGHNCNDWTRDCLDRGGVSMTSAWITTAGSVVRGAQRQEAK